ncbi:C2 family cysteine protease [Humisphaera borealis]|uniref:Calpain catalytic domain-containing protein n=1 Tax=Humisphaera borealis TaxID=2807512 RepID=A0A7M2X110_9BACT|nr:C2 family cysteine protease [Humisphaera borealis]QOV91427.1 hypothetical protein IPV69_08755 [Humisphaera borealis]
MFRSLVNAFRMSKTSHQTSTKAAKATKSISHFEQLEGRQLMSATYALQPVAATTAPALVITASAKADNIQFSRTATGGIAVSAEGKLVGVITKTVSQIVVNALGGNDRIIVDANVTVPATLNGGDGNDFLRGGGAKDILAGGNGNDTLVSIGGGSTDMLSGGAGRDGFWLDSTDTVSDADSAENGVGAVHKISSFVSYKTMVGGKAVTVTPSKELLGQNFADSDVSGYNAVGTINVKNQPLFSAAGPAADDIRQGNVGSCYFISTLSSVAAKNAERIRQSVVDLGDGTFAVRLKNGAADAYVRVDADLPMGKDGQLMGCRLGAGNSSWVAIMEKALTMFRTKSGNFANNGFASYKRIDGGFLDEGMGYLGVKNIEANKFGMNPFANGMAMFNWIATKAQQGKIVTFGTGKIGTFSGTPAVELHAYSVAGLSQDMFGQPILVLRNPWAKDGPIQQGANDGYIGLTMNEAMYVCAGVSAGNA